MPSYTVSPLVAALLADIKRSIAHANGRDFQLIRTKEDDDQPAVVAGSREGKGAQKIPVCDICSAVDAACCGRTMTYMFFLLMLLMGVDTTLVKCSQDQGSRRVLLLLHFMICHSNKCHRPRTSSCHKEQPGGTEYG